MKLISRRELLTLSAVVPLAAPAILQARATPTAQEIVDRIKKKMGAEWKMDGVDTFKAGDPATPVKGIVTTSMATLPVLKRAVEVGANFVITCEPTFYSRTDSATPAGARRGAPAAPDPVFTGKNDFIKSNNLVIWRFSDNWRQRTADPFSAALAQKLSWEKRGVAGDTKRFTIPYTTLESLAADVKKQLQSRGGMRIVGDPKQKISKVGLLPGTTAIQAALALFPLVDAIIAGEVREWESVELARDKINAGESKSLILLGRLVSENPGMNECAAWLKDVTPEIKILTIPVEDPYWRPA